MAGFSPGNVALVSLGGVDISPYVEKIDMDIKSAIMPLPRLGSNGTAHLPAPTDTEFTLTFWLDSVITNILFALAYTRPATTAQLVYKPEGVSGDTRTVTVFCSDYHEDSDAKSPNKGTCKLTTSDGVIA